MALSWRRPAARSITTAAVGLLTLGFLVSCGGNASPSTQSSAAAGASVGQTAATSQPSSASGEVRLGCGTYCQSAGGVGGPGPTGQPAVTIVSSGTVAVDADGYAPVTVTCNLSVQCRGALVISGAGDVCKSDLVLDAGATATFGVRLSARALYFVQHQGVPTTVQVVANSFQSPGTGHWDPGEGGWAGGITPLDVTNLYLVAPS
jgi:hypothetical protein